MVKMHAKGIVVIPKAVREAAGLAPGCELNICAREGKVVIEAEGAAAKRWEDEFERLVEETATHSHQEVENRIRIAEEARRARSLVVPGMETEQAELIEKIARPATRAVRPAVENRLRKVQKRPKTAISHVP